MTMLTLEITAQAGRRHVSYLREMVLLAHQHVERCVLRELSLVLVGDQTMSRLHRQFMNIDGPTDVLTFPLEFDEHGNATVGEVVVCVPEAQRQAGREDDRLRRELLLYALHGILHLSGHDDKNKKDFQIMHLMEDSILSELGVGPVFKHPKDALHEKITEKTR